MLTLCLVLLVAEVASFAKRSRHGAAQWAAQAKIEVAPGATEVASRFFWGREVRLQFSLVRPLCCSRGADFLDLAWPEATQNPKNPRRATLVKAKMGRPFANGAPSASHKNYNKSFFVSDLNRLYSSSFVKASALGGLPSSGTAVLNDLLNKKTKKPKNGFEPMYPEHFCVPKTMVTSVSAQTPVFTDFLKKHPNKNSKAPCGALRCRSFRALAGRPAGGQRTLR